MKITGDILKKDHRKLWSGFIITVYLGLMIWIIWFVGRPMLAFASQPEEFREWVDAYGIWSRIGYIGMVLLQVFVAVIPGEPLEIGGGYAFGMLEGTFLCLAGAVIGSILVFGFVRYFGIRMVEVFYSREKIQALRFLRNSKRRDLLFFFLFLIPGTPKDLLCYFAGLTDMRWTTWLFICFWGRIPSIITSAIGGNALGTKNYMAAGITAIATLAVSLIGVVSYRTICKKQEMKQVEK